MAMAVRVAVVEVVADCRTDIIRLRMELQLLVTKDRLLEHVRCVTIDPCLHHLRPQRVEEEHQYDIITIPLRQMQCRVCMVCLVRCVHIQQRVVLSMADRRYKPTIRIKRMPRRMIIA